MTKESRSTTRTDTLHNSYRSVTSIQKQGSLEHDTNLTFFPRTKDILWWFTLVITFTLRLGYRPNNRVLVIVTGRNKLIPKEKTIVV